MGLDESMEVLLQNKWIWVCIALLILEEAIHAKQNTIKAGVCPRCGGQLVERNGRYESLWDAVTTRSADTCRRCDVEYDIGATAQEF